MKDKNLHKSYGSCPYCGKSDGNDDIDLDKHIDYMDYTECQITVTRECDICGKNYEVKKVYKFAYENVDFVDE